MVETRSKRKREEALAEAQTQDDKQQEKCSATSNDEMARIEEDLRRWREKAAARQAARAQEAREAMESSKRPAFAELVPVGSTPLPQEIWAAVFTHLASTLEPAGVRGPGVVAADMVRAGLACRDMCRAAQTGLQALAERVTVREDCHHIYGHAGRTEFRDSSVWDGLLRRPHERKVPELKAALREWGLPVSGTKAELVLRLLEHFGLRARCPVPGRLWVALRQERNGQAEPLSLQLRFALDALVRLGHPEATAACQETVLAHKRRLLATTFGDSAGVLAARDARRVSQVQEGLQARRAVAQGASMSPVLCVCGSPAAKACSLVLCGNCCREFRTSSCSRHREAVPPMQA